MGPNCFVLPDHEVKRKAGSVGFPVFHAGMRVIAEDGHLCGPGEVGELQITGTHLCSGHWRNPEESLQANPDGWFRTGDLVYRDEVGRAVVALKPGTAVDAANLIAFCRERLAHYKVPKQVAFLPALPKSAAGKILKREVRQLLL